MVYSTLALGVKPAHGRNKKLDGVNHVGPNTVDRRAYLSRGECGGGKCGGGEMLI